MKSSPENAPDPTRPSVPGGPASGQNVQPQYTQGNPYAGLPAAGSPFSVPASAGLPPGGQSFAAASPAEQEPRLSSGELALRLGAFVVAYVLVSFLTRFLAASVAGRSSSFMDPTQAVSSVIFSLPPLAGALAAWLVPRPLPLSTVGNAVRPGGSRVLILTALAWLVLPLIYAFVFIPLSGDAGGWLVLALLPLAARALLGIPAALILAFVVLCVLWPLFVRRGFSPFAAGLLAAAVPWLLNLVLQGVSLLALRPAAEMVGPVIGSSALYAVIATALFSAAAPLGLGRSVPYRMFLFALPYAAWTINTSFMSIGVATATNGRSFLPFACLVLAPAVLFVLPCVLWARADARRRAQTPTPDAAL